LAAAGVGAGVPAAVLTVANGRAMAGHLASLEARLGLSDDDFSGLSSGCEDDYSGDDQSDDNFNGGGAAVAGAQPVLAVVDVVHDEPAGREKHWAQGFSPVVGAVQEICAHGAEFCMLHVRGADGVDVDIGLAPNGKGTLFGTPLTSTLAGRCFLTLAPQAMPSPGALPSARLLGSPTWSRCLPSTHVYKACVPYMGSKHGRGCRD